MGDSREQWMGTDTEGRQNWVCAQATNYQSVGFSG